MSRGHIVRINL